MRPRHLLIVDDNKADIFLIREALDLAGVNAQIHIVNDGQAARLFFEAADREPGAPVTAMVLLDLNLPKANGEEVLALLRASVACRQAQVVVVTSSDSPRDRERLTNLGIAGYFRKPSEYNEFLKLGPIVKDLFDPQQP